MTKINNQYQLLARLMLDAQKTIRSLTRKAYTGFNPAEFNLLILLTSKSDISASELAEIMHTSKSKISRLLSSLSKKTVIKISTCNQDARKTLICINKKGAVALQELDKLSEQATSSWYKKLSKTQAKVFERFLKDYSDYLKAMPEQARKNETSIRVQQRRIARVAGLHGNKIFGTKLPLIEYQVLLALIQSADSLALSELFKLPFDIAEISRVATSLERIGWIKKNKNSSNKRACTVTLTAKGKKIYLGEESKIVKDIKLITKNYATKDLVQLREALQIVADSE